eukprot:13140021-Alexandrium_andersonii.AAC.1
MAAQDKTGPGLSKLAAAALERGRAQHFVLAQRKALPDDRMEPTGSTPHDTMGARGARPPGLLQVGGSGAAADHLCRRH